MTDIEHAKKYAEESISLAISMYNPKAEIIAETACLYGLTFKNERIAELEKENAELKSIAEFQQSSNMSRHFENKKLKEGLAVGSMWNKHLNSQNKALEEERDKYRDMTFDQREQLTKAKEIIREFVEWATWQGSNCPNFKSIQDKAEQFLKENEE